MYNSPPVQVNVGPVKDCFYIHEALLRACSAFFDRALGGPSQEASTNHIRLPDDDPRVFRVFVDWLYLDKLCLPRPDSPGEATHNLALEVWIFGDKYGIHKLQNLAIDAWHGIDHTHSSISSALSLVYNSTPIGSLLRKMYAEVYACRGNMKVFKPECKADLPKDFLIDIIMFQGSAGVVRLMLPDLRNSALIVSGGSTSNQPLGCRFHVHPGGDEKCGS